MRRNHAETHSECIDQAAPRCQIFQWQRFRYSAINSRDIAKGLRNDTAHTYGAALPTESSRAMVDTRGVPSDARDILVEWFKDVKEGISHLSIGRRATSPAQRTVGVTVAPF